MLSRTPDLAMVDGQGIAHPRRLGIAAGAATVAKVLFGIFIVVFLILGCLLEGLPAVLLLAPLMVPIARKLGIHDVHYSMVIVCAMNVGLMMPPIGVGFYVACRIGDVKPEEVMAAIWPYLVALMVGVAAIAAFPVISTIAL